MKKSIIIILGLFFMGIFLFSCEKRIIESTQFDVQTDSISYKKGQPVIFNFKGNAHNIVFWSGEKGHIFANRNRTIEQGVLQTVQFTSLAGAGTQNSNLAVMVSSDFSGTYDTTNIVKATWTDITSRAVLSSTATSGAGTSISSGAVNITDLGNVNNKPVYFAFHYISQFNTLIPRQWTISAFTVVNTLADGTANTVVANLANAGFQGINVRDLTHQWAFTPNILNPTSMTIVPAGAGAPINDDWAISVPVKLNTVSLADYGVPVISITTLSPPTSYSYLFTVAGTYKVTFYAFNEDLNDTIGIVKELTITIRP